jgi:hypothetical protein
MTFSERERVGPAMTATAPAAGRKSQFNAGIRRAG